MSETKFTPGPWSRENPGTDADGYAIGVVVAATYGRQKIYATPQGGSFPSADATLIAAAPELYAALEALLERNPNDEFCLFCGWENTRGHNAVCRVPMATKALAKARGERP